MSGYIAIFIAVFLAELGDKTQLATLVFASENQQNAWGVFVAAALAMVLSTAIAVLLGSLAGKYLQFIPLKLIAGCMFIGIGMWSVAEHYRG